MLAQLRQLYPQCSLVSELIDIDRGLYIVKASIQVDGVTLTTGLAATERIETAEDRARERAIAALSLEVLTSLASRPPSPTISAAKSTTPNVTPLNERKIEQPISDESKVVNFSFPPHPTKSSDLSPKTTDQEVSITEEASNSDSPATSWDEEQSQGEIDEVSESKELPVDEIEPENLMTLETPSPLELSDNVASTPQVVEIDFNEIKHKTDIEIKRLGWTKEDGRNFLKSHYGKRTRLHLTDEQLLEFLHYLESLPTPLER
jgi:hypothetical protein